MSNPSSSLTILVVEDDQMLSLLFSNVITRSSNGQYSVARCGSIAQALEHLASLTIEAVLLDLHLPDSSGLHSLTTIVEQYPDLPIIIMTGTDNDELALESLKRGAEDYIVKGRLDGISLCRAISHAIERRKTLIEMKNLHDILHKERRLEALGAISSGIAHEINTPLQFIGTNLEFIKEVFSILDQSLSACDAIPCTGRTSKESENKMRSLVTALTADRMTALRREVPNALAEAVEGIRRVKRIITAMNVFSRTGCEQKTLYDVNRAVRDALTITRHEWKHIATTEIYLDDNIPLVPCYPEELSHCLLNLLINSVHAIEDAKHTCSNGRKGVITVNTEKMAECVEIRIGDSGIGIPQSIHHRVFEPFFTTKEVGRGSGQGLSIVYQMVVKHMGGSVTFESHENQGTVFKISLPLHAIETEHEIAL